MYDAIVVGARCAGASTAMLLARKGHRILLVDRAKFPSDIPHGHFIHRGGPARLGRWGLLARILATGCPAIDTQVLDIAGFPLTGRNLVVDGIAFGCGPRRKVLDKVLIDAAVEAGVEFREQFAVDNTLTEAGRIRGIIGYETASRSRITERARLVIGADGRNSRLARIVAAVTYEAVPPLTCWYFSYWSGDFEKTLALHATDRNVIFTFPTNDKLQAVFVGWPAEAFHRVRQDIHGSFMNVLWRVPELADRIEAGRQEERFYGTADVPNFYRKSVGAGWALVGDAGCHKDPYLALGIADALRDAELLSDAAHEGLSERRPMEEALATYEKRRDGASAADYQENIQAARLMPLPEEMQALFAALRGCDEDTRQFLLARQQLLPPGRFFNRENIRRIMAAPTRRTFLATGMAGAAVLGVPALLRAEAPSVKLGLIHTVTGPLAEPGQACRLGALMAADAVNAAGGIKSMGGATLEPMLGDTQTRQDVARAEAERVINAGAQLLMGTFNSGDTAAIVPIAQQRRVPFLVDISAADAITANVAKSVKEGQQKVQYVYRNFPTGTALGEKAVQYFTEIFREAGMAPTRVVLMHANDLFGQNQARGFLAAHKAARPAWDIVEVIAWAEPPADLSTEVSRAKAAKPDVIAPITRPASAQLLLPELARQRVEIMGIVGPGSPGLFEKGQIAVLKEHSEYVMASAPWPNLKNPRARLVAGEYEKRSGGKIFDTNSGYSYDGILLLADILERAGQAGVKPSAWHPDGVVGAIKNTSFTGGLMVYGGPVVFNEIGDNPNAVPVMVQVLHQRPAVVWPKDAAAERFVFPRPKR